MTQFIRAVGLFEKIMEEETKEKTPLAEPPLSPRTPLDNLKQILSQADETAEGNAKHLQPSTNSPETSSQEEPIKEEQRTSPELTAEREFAFETESMKKLEERLKAFKKTRLRMTE